MINPQGSFKSCAVFVAEFVVGFSFQEGILLLAIWWSSGKLFCVQLLLQSFCCCVFCFEGFLLLAIWWSWKLQPMMEVCLLLLQWCVDNNYNGHVSSPWHTGCYHLPSRESHQCGEEHRQCPCSLQTGRYSFCLGLLRSFQSQLHSSMSDYFTGFVTLHVCRLSELWQSWGFTRDWWGICVCGSVCCSLRKGLSH